MKKEVHPKYQTINFTCACGAAFTAGSTMGDDFTTEICSNCHPFYTGKQKLIDTSGRVDKFVAKMKKAQDLAAKTTKETDEEITEVAEEVEEVEKAEKVEKKKEVAETPAKEAEEPEAPKEDAEAKEEAPEEKSEAPAEDKKASDS